MQWPRFQSCPLLARSQGFECSYFNSDAVYCLLPNFARQQVIKNQKASLSRVLHLMRFTPASPPSNPNSKPTCLPAGLRCGLQPPRAPRRQGLLHWKLAPGLSHSAQPPATPQAPHPELRSFLYPLKHFLWYHEVHCKLKWNENHNRLPILTFITSPYHQTGGGGRESVPLHCFQSRQRARKHGAGAGGE